jgi:spore coat protein CotH
MRIIGSALAAILTLSGISTSANAASPLTLTDIYSPTKVLTVALTLPAESVASLNNPATLEVYVPGTLVLTSGTKTSGSLDISVRLKGSTSLQKLDWTPSFKFKFKKNNGLGYLGLRRMTLNAMSQDGGKVHEFASYALFNAMGVNSSKTGWARVYVNGVDKGLYLNVETVDETFFQRRVKDITQHIYEGQGSDFWDGSANGDNKSGTFTVDYGWKVTPNKYDLANLIRVANSWKQDAWWAELNNFTNRTQMIKFFAVENFIGHWDGYSGPDKNNFYVRSNTKGQFVFVPWGLDQTMGEDLSTYKVGDSFLMPMLSDRSDHPWAKDMTRGRLYVQCINYLPCKNQYLAALKEVSNKASSIGLIGKIKSASKVIDTVLTQRFKGNLDAMKSLDDIHAEQDRTMSYITNRQKEVAALLKANGIK